MGLEAEEQDRRKDADGDRRGLDADAYVQTISDVIDGFILSCRNDASYTVTHISAGFEKLFGYDIEEFMSHGAKYVALIHHSDLPAVTSAVSDALSQGRRWQINYRLRTLSGHWRHVLETGAGRVNAQGKILHLDCLVMDFARMNELVGRLEAGEAALDAIETAVARILNMLQTLRMLSFNARIEAARSTTDVGFDEVAREMSSLATIGDEVAHGITTELNHLRKAVRP